MGFFEKKPDLSQVTKEPAAPSVGRSAENVTKKIVPEAIGTIVTPSRADGNKGTALELPDNIFVGSVARQKQVEQFGRNADELKRELHSAELVTDIFVPTGEYGVTRLGSHREFSYVQTPDKRLHADKCTLEISEPEKEKDGVKKIIEQRSFTSDGKVASNERVVEKTDGTKEKGVEKIGYDDKGNVLVRQYGLWINDQEVYRTEISLDPADPQKIITQVVREERPGQTTSPGQKISSAGGEKFRNEFASDMLKLLED